MVSIIVGFVFYILCSAIGHQNFVFTVCCAIGHALLCVAKIGARMIITYSVAECIAVIVLSRLEELEKRKWKKMRLNGVTLEIDSNY